MRNSAVIALGSNIKPEKHIDEALNALIQTFDLKLKSSFGYTKPVGYQPQPDFLNGAVLVESDAGKATIIRHLKQIEETLGRDRSRHKDGSRRIDLDLIVYNGCITDNDVYERDFLQRSIHELLPGFEIINDQSVK